MIGYDAIEDAIFIAMLVYLYRWKLKVGLEPQFQAAWSHVTRELKARAGSLGSRLHLGDDGWWYGYAQWPSAEVRERAQLTDDATTTARALMRDATEATLPDIVLTVAGDFLVLPPG